MTTTDQLCLKSLKRNPRLIMPPQTEYGEQVALESIRQRADAVIGLTQHVDGISSIGGQELARRVEAPFRECAHACSLHIPKRISLSLSLTLTLSLSLTHTLSPSLSHYRSTHPSIHPSIRPSISYPNPKPARRRRKPVYGALSPCANGRGSRGGLLRHMLSQG